jgi:hypothetical protein
MDVAPRLQAATQTLAQFEQALRSHRPVMTPPSPVRVALYQKLGKPLPSAEPDFDAAPWLRWIGEVRAAVAKQDGYTLEPLIESLKSSVHTGRFAKLGLDLTPLVQNMEGLGNALMSHSPSGWRRTENRRAVIYSKLAGRYFGDGWDVSIQGTRFEITRNGSVA